MAVLPSGREVPPALHARCRSDVPGAARSLRAPSGGKSSAGALVCVGRLPGRPAAQQQQQHREGLPSPGLWSPVSRATATLAEAPAVWKDHLLPERSWRCGGTSPGCTHPSAPQIAPMALADPPGRSRWVWAPLLPLPLQLRDRGRAPAVADLPTHPPEAQTPPSSQLTFQQCKSQGRGGKSAPEWDPGPSARGADIVWGCV